MALQSHGSNAVTVDGGGRGSNYPPGRSSLVPVKQSTSRAITIPVEIVSALFLDTGEVSATGRYVTSLETETETLSGSELIHSRHSAHLDTQSQPVIGHRNAGRQSQIGDRVASRVKRCNHSVKNHANYYSVLDRL
ncbi:hypothetical protein QQS21_006991 [Conoideocrella luteorostrata]|uniref:Uncharacterized protein n=1 Tax=Conoideocrella luteorostrata TaxID=1105319 RepID=A0AAJ0CLI9_9HYPO|nr:hypothetical protein QQS21_006991 [Conoideocrella luteorostrata]